MKNKEQYYAVNNQEDEDVYTLYPGKAIIYENVKRKQYISSSNITANTDPGSAKLALRRDEGFRSFILSPSAMLNKIT